MPEHVIADTDAPGNGAGTSPALSGVPSPTPSNHPRTMFAVVVVALMMSALDSTIVATALHSLQQGLNASITLVGWTITAYSLGRVLLLPVAAKLTMRYGPRRVFLVSVSLFTAASLFCGLATSIYLLVGLRLIQAVGGAGFTPTATKIVVDHFGPSRDKAVGIFGSAFTTGALIGPLLGGLIVASWSWRGVFLVNVPLGIALIPLCLRYVPADGPRQPGQRTSLDIPGVVLLGSGLLAAMIGLAYLGDTPPGWALPCGVALAVSVIALAAFTWHVERVRDPLIPPRLIHGRGFGAVNLICVVYSGFGGGMVALIPLYAANRYGFGAFESGTLLAAQAVGAIALSTAGAFLLRRTGYRLPLYSAAVLVALGVVMIAITPLGLPTYAWLATGAGLIGIGIGWSSPASRNAGLQLVPGQAASIAVLRSTAIQVGSITAVSVTTAIIAHAADPGSAQAWVYAIYAGVLLFIGLPSASRILEHKGAW